MASTRTLIYKRTHTGDPDSSGCFGIRDCMGGVRKQAFDAVIGVGGIGAKARAAGIAGKITWIGVGAHPTNLKGLRGPLITFDHFVLFDDKGKDLDAVAPALSQRMYSTKGPRLVNDNSLTENEKTGVQRILQMARGMPPS